MKQILIADDDKNITTALTRRLEANGFKVVRASDGFEVLDLLTKTTPDLLLLDIWMPAGHGLFVSEKVHQLGLRIPIVFLTASKLPGLRAAARATGAAGYIEKPYDPDQLLHTIREALRAERECVAA
jgi:CheY-like chemotaxis protein